MRGHFRLCGLGWGMRPTFSKNVCLHKIRTAAGFWSQNTKSSVNVFWKPGNEKVFFHENWHVLSQSQLKSANFDETFITRESICGHVRLCGLGWGPIWGRLFEKMLFFGRSMFFMFFVVRTGSFLETPFFVAISKNAKWKMTLTGLKPTFRPIWELFSVTFGRFSL